MRVHCSLECVRRPSERNRRPIYYIPCSRYMRIIKNIIFRLIFNYSMGVYGDCQIIHLNSNEVIDRIWHICIITRQHTGPPPNQLSVTRLTTSILCPMQTHRLPSQRNFWLGGDAMIYYTARMLMRQNLISICPLVPCFFQSRSQHGQILY